MGKVCGRGLGWFSGLIFGVGGTACSGGPTDSGQSGSASLTIVAGDRLTDTVDAIPAQAIRVSVRDRTGALRAGMQVRFSRVFSDSLAPVFVGAITDAGFASTVSTTTDAAGEAGARVRLGSRIGAGIVVIEVPETSLADTAHYTVTPGHIAGVRMLPADTALYVGRSFTLRITAVDRQGHTTPEAPAVQVAGSSATIRSAGASITGLKLGRGAVVASAGGFSDTSVVSVVPTGTIVAWRATFESLSPALVIANLDGSGYRELIPGPETGVVGVTADWDPTGQWLVITKDGNPVLYRLDPSNGTTTVLPVANPDLQTELWPQTTADGQWMYFGSSNNYRPGTIWRSRLDGSGAMQVGPGIGGFVDQFPSPSPDGTRVAYISNRPPFAAIRILNLGTGQETVLPAFGSPRWSPLGDLIAVLGTDEFNTFLPITAGLGPLWLIHPDGTGQSIVGGDATYYGGFDWSPDGRFLIAGAADFTTRLELIEVATRMRLTLPFTRLWTNPSWKP